LYIKWPELNRGVGVTESAEIKERLHTGVHKEEQDLEKNAMLVAERENQASTEEVVPG
jgi:hypothetical protein